MLTETWSAATLADVYDNGPGYTYSLICDYERYVRDFGYIPITTFISGWTCITYKKFVNLCIGDIVYAPTGLQYIVVDEPYSSDDEDVYIEVVMMKDDGSYDRTGKSNETRQTGDLYWDKVTHNDYRRKKIKAKESEVPICPILITKTNPPQS